MITVINWFNTSRKHVSSECKCKFDGRKCNSNQKWNNSKCWYECWKNICAKKIMFGIPLLVVVKMVNI